MPSITELPVPPGVVVAAPLELEHAAASKATAIRESPRSARGEVLISYIIDAEKRL